MKMLAMIAKLAQKPRSLIALCFSGLAKPTLALTITIFALFACLLKGANLFIKDLLFFCWEYNA